MMKIGRIPASVLLLALGGFGAAQDAVSIVRTPKLGEITTYTVKMDLDMGGRKVTVTNKVAEKVVKVDPNGEYTVESSYSDTKVKLAGGAESDSTQAADTVVYKPDGMLSKVVGAKVDGSMVRLGNMLAVKLPGKPVKVGDTWSMAVTADPKTGAEAAKADYKVLGREKVGQFDCLSVSVKYMETSGEKPAACDETLWLDVATGTLVRRTATYKNLPTSYTTVKQTITATLRVDRDAPAAAPMPVIKGTG